MADREIHVTQRGRYSWEVKVIDRRYPRALPDWFVWTSGFRAKQRAIARAKRYLALMEARDRYEAQKIVITSEEATR